MSKEMLLEQLKGYNIDDISYCSSCGAYSITVNGELYSVHKKNMLALFPNLDKEIFKRYIKKVITNTFCCCNWCANRWGLDLCACGSGKPYKSCKDYKGVCGRPMQEIDSHTFVRGKNAWI